jgi:5-methylcytosine-specific restriction protein A
MQIPYIVGQEYTRQTDIHDRFGGSRQSGMSTTANYPLIFLFTGPTGEQHGYSDGFASNGQFYYTGEGQVGDMAFTKGNKAVRNHIKNEKHVLLFEQLNGGQYTYTGEFSYIGHHLEIKPDREGNNRNSIVFELAFEPLNISRNFSESTNLPPPKKLPKTLSTSELRSIAETGSSVTISAKTIQTRLYNRSVAVKRYALARAKGKCECCGIPAPFLNKQKQPYLEVHHLFRVADGGPDSPEGVAAICPTCHREIHNGIDGETLNTKLSIKIDAFESTIGEPNEIL